MASQPPPAPGPAYPAAPPQAHPGHPGQPPAHDVPVVVFGTIGLLFRWCSLWIPSSVAVIAVTVLVVALAPGAVAGGGEVLGDVGAALVAFFENLVGFVGGPFA